MNEHFLQGVPTQLHFRVTRRGSLYEAQCSELPGIITISTVHENRLRFYAEDAIKDYLLAMITVTIEEEGKRDDHGDH